MQHQIHVTINLSSTTQHNKSFTTNYPRPTWSTEQRPLTWKTQFSVNTLFSYVFNTNILPNHSPTKKECINSVDISFTCVAAMTPQLPQWHHSPPDWPRDTVKNMFTNVSDFRVSRSRHEPATCPPLNVATNRLIAKSAAVSNSQFVDTLYQLLKSWDSTHIIGTDSCKLCGSSGLVCKRSVIADWRDEPAASVIQQHHHRCVTADLSFFLRQHLKQRRTQPSWRPSSTLSSFRSIWLRCVLTLSHNFIDIFYLHSSAQKEISVATADAVLF